MALQQTLWRIGGIETFRLLRTHMKRVLLLLAAWAMLWPAISQAWWNAEWTGRRKVTLDTSEQAAAVGSEVVNLPVLVRLHTGNFPFAEADVDGKDLRFVASDDKTPLKHHVELFDSVNELALVWVMVPRLAAKDSGGHVWMYYGNAKAQGASDSQSTYDATHALVLHFAEKAGAFQDATAYSQAIRIEGVTAGAAGVADGAAVFGGAARVVVPASPSIKAGAAGLTMSAWIKAADPNQRAVLFGLQDGAFQVIYDGGKVLASVRGAGTSGVDVAAGAWHHVAVTIADRTVVYVDGREAATSAAAVGELTGESLIGAGFRGEMDEFQLSMVARSPAWIRAQVASEGEGGPLVKVAAEGETGDAESASYFRILLSAVTLDGWVVIGILLVMMVISFAVMIGKGVLLIRTDAANKAFQRKFADVADDLFALEGEATAGRAGQASLVRIYGTAVRELKKRFAGGTTGAPLSSQSIDAIRASLDANVVRENARLNSQMVLLTIAISGGPFLGLLGTVVGVMITFAAIAAVGDVNVNSIAPGIAAALVATVAGLGVAIPALFGYNYLASRIKGISADMQVFVDELVSRIAERYAP